jgi:hypothetical protein
MKWLWSAQLHKPLTAFFDLDFVQRCGQGDLKAQVGTLCGRGASSSTEAPLPVSTLRPSVCPDKAMTEKSWFDLAWTQEGSMKAILSTLLGLGCLLLAACSGGDIKQTPLQTPGSSTSSDVEIIETNTQMHLKGVALGVGNIREEMYLLADGAQRHGLTAALFISVENDSSQNRTLRVHSGQDLAVPGYRLHVVLVEKTRIQLKVAETQ